MTFLSPWLSYQISCSQILSQSKKSWLNLFCSPSRISHLLLIFLYLSLLGEHELLLGHRLLLLLLVCQEGLLVGGRILLPHLLNILSNQLLLSELLLLGKRSLHLSLIQILILVLLKLFSHLLSLPLLFGLQSRRLRHFCRLFLSQTWTAGLNSSSSSTLHWKKTLSWGHFDRTLIIVGAFGQIFIASVTHNTRRLSSISGSGGFSRRRCHFLAGSAMDWKTSCCTWIAGSICDWAGDSVATKTARDVRFYGGFWTSSSLVLTLRQVTLVGVRSHWSRMLVVHLL